MMAGREHSPRVPPGGTLLPVTPEMPGSQGVPEALAAELAGRAWGGLPALYLVELDGGTCGLYPLPVPARAWRSHPVHVVVTVTAGSIGRADAGPADPVFAGAAVRFEDWDLPWAFLDGPARRDAAAALAAGTVHARPDRIRTRFVLAAGRDGTAWLARQHRHSAAPTVVTCPAGSPRPPAPPRAWAAIGHFARTVLGPLPPGPEKSAFT